MAYILSTCLALVGLVGCLNAHMLLLNPSPIGNPHNGPLVRSGIPDYPCQITDPSVYKNVQKRTELVPGSDFTVVFKGDAVHGGGSCQFSLTKDPQPGVDSVFKVIHSVEGGCPARRTPGNRGDDAEAIDPDTYTFHIPPQLEIGTYFFSWTWINKVGNREFYMNCAAVEVNSSPRADPEFFQSLPDMVILNTAVDTCSNEEDALDNTAFKYADSGLSLEINEPNVPHKDLTAIVPSTNKNRLPQCAAGGRKITTQIPRGPDGQAINSLENVSNNQSTATSNSQPATTNNSNKPTLAPGSGGARVTTNLASKALTTTTSFTTITTCQTPSANSKNKVYNVPIQTSHLTINAICRPETHKCMKQGITCLSSTKFISCDSVSSSDDTPACAALQEVAVGMGCVEGEIVRADYAAATISSRDGANEGEGVRIRRGSRLFKL